MAMPQPGGMAAPQPSYQGVQPSDMPHFSAPGVQHSATNQEQEQHRDGNK